MTVLPTRARVVEVGLRDGLQAVPTPLATSDKLAIVDALLASGVRHIEAVSFAHPRVLPQLADAEQVMASVPREHDVTYRGLVPNLRGAQRAVECDLDEWVLVISADDQVSRKNQNRSTDQMLDELIAVADLARAHHVRLVVAVACAFFAPASGPVPSTAMIRVVRAAVEAGATGVYLAATSGQEHPVEISAGLTTVRAAYPGLELGVHLHNRNGFAPANALAALASGATWLESSFCGLGGDLWFPGDPTVLGNYATEDLVHLCDSAGVDTGIDLRSYLGVVRLVEEKTGRPSTSFVTRGGTRQDLAAAAWPEESA